MATPTTTGSLFRTKTVEQSIADTDEPDSKLRRELGAALPQSHRRARTVRARSAPGAA